MSACELACSWPDGVGKMSACELACSWDTGGLPEASRAGKGLARDCMPGLCLQGSP
jgi:hypothetical protein